MNLSQQITLSRGILHPCFLFILNNSNMPILNHLDINDIVNFRSFHNSWAVHIAEDLNKLLPKGFRATPHAQMGSREIDVRTDRTLTEIEKEQFISLYQPTSPPMTARATFPTEIEVFVLNVRRPAYKTVGAVEIVSVGNKDRPESRNAFVAKCQNLLSQDISLVIVDVLAVPSFNLHHQLLRALEIPEGKKNEETPLYCAAYCKSFDMEELPTIDFWAYALKVGDILPQLPLFITSDVAVPVDLEKTYTEVCEGLKVFE